MNAAKDAVRRLLLSHAGLGPVFNYKSLYSIPELEILEQKQTLLAHACKTNCAMVVEDVLLFLSTTLSESIFHRELSIPTNVLALEQWANYLRQQQLVNQSSTFVSLQDYPLIALYRGVRRYTEMATEMVQLIFAQTNKTLAMEWALEAQKIFQRTRQPQWIQTQLQQYIWLQNLQEQVEAIDEAIAPEAREKAGHGDQRSFTQGLNWHKRYFELRGEKLTIRKHEPEKVARSSNPFLDKREEEIILTKDMVVTRKHHQSSTHAKQLDRPHCLELLQGSRTLLIMDTWSESAQAEWINALEVGIKRVGLDHVWLVHPRPSVLGMPFTQFLSYCMIYPDSSTAANSSESDDYAWNSPRIQMLCTKFDVDMNRLLYLSIVYCGQTNKWDALAALTRPGKVKRLFTSQPQSTIGFGAFLDTAYQYRATPDIIAFYKGLYEKQTKGWSSLYLRLEGNSS